MLLISIALLVSSIYYFKGRKTRNSIQMFISQPLLSFIYEMKSKKPLSCFHFMGSYLRCLLDMVDKFPFLFLIY